MNTKVAQSEHAMESLPLSNKRVWAGRILSGLSVAFLLFDALVKVFAAPMVAEASAELGYPASAIRGIGITLLVSVVTYALPRTSVLGGVLLTGYLGGAIATHVRVGNPLFSHVLFPVYVAAMIWGGLFLRDERLRVFLPWHEPRG
ncbi:Arginine/ornithine antiporter ArcD [Minicystis rosea]|nr:Arginine/ornithine antiporter ArcD [Minicystis rosea]